MNVIIPQNTNGGPNNLAINIRGEESPYNRFGYEFTDTVVARVLGQYVNSKITLIQTDIPIYKPGQTGMYYAKFTGGMVKVDRPNRLTKISIKRCSSFKRTDTFADVIWNFQSPNIGMYLHGFDKRIFPDHSKWSSLGERDNRQKSEPLVDCICSPLLGNQKSHHEHCVF